jgi:hypothetical protein
MLANKSKIGHGVQCLAVLCVTLCRFSERLPSVYCTSQF